MRNGPLEIALLLLIGLAGCRGSETENASGGAPASKPGAPAQTKTLTGLYEGGDGPRRNQMCIIEREGRSSSFGFVTWGAGNKNCSGSGTARRENDVLRLSLDGDESCALEARIDGGQVTLPTSIPSNATLLLWRRRADGRRELRQGWRRAGGCDAGRGSGRRSALRRLSRGVRRYVDVDVNVK
jgi:hypothetical protein